MFFYLIFEGLSLLSLLLLSIWVFMAFYLLLCQLCSFVVCLYLFPIFCLFVHSSSYQLYASFVIVSLCLCSFLLVSWSTFCFWHFLFFQKKIVIIFYGNKECYDLCGLGERCHFTFCGICWLVFHRLNLKWTTL